MKRYTHGIPLLFLELWNCQGDGAGKGTVRAGKGTVLLPACSQFVINAGNRTVPLPAPSPWQPARYSDRGCGVPVQGCLFWAFDLN